MRNFLVLETFRFIGAIIVTLGHFFWGNGHPEAIPNSYILVVEFFFVLSAFLITLKQNPEKQGKTDVYLNNFFLGRCIRILFPYMIVLTFYYLTVFRILYPLKVSLFRYFVNIFLLQILGLNDNFPISEANVTVITAWALGLELYIGTIFFSIVYFVKRNFKQGLFFICLITFIIFLNIMKKYSPNYMDIHYLEIFNIPMGIFRVILSYTSGTIFAIFYKFVKEKNIKYKLIIFNILEILVLYFIIRFYGKINYNRENEYIFPIVIGIAIVIFAHEIGFLSFILKKFSHLGKLSYSIYVIHPIFYEILRHYKIFNLPIYLLCIISSSFLFYFFVEKNIIKLKYKTINKKNVEI